MFNKYHSKWIHKTFSAAMLRAKNLSFSKITEFLFKKMFFKYYNLVICDVKTVQVPSNLKFINILRVLLYIYLLCIN